jgi:hypothetical protein
MELRLYSFVNFYLSSIQQGIQTGHAAVDLVRKYTANGNPLRRDITSYHEHLVEQWADAHKTFIILNGGDSVGIANATSLIARNGVFPWAIFKESDISLSGIQTCVAVVLPEYIFNATKRFKADGDYEWVYMFEEEQKEQIYTRGHEHFELVNFVKSCRLAS